MASSFKNAINASVGTSAVDVYTAPVGMSTTVIGLSLANITTSQITGTVTMTKSGITVHVIKDAPIPVGSSLVLFGGDQKLVLETGNKMTVTSNTIAGIGVIVSVLELG